MADVPHPPTGTLPTEFAPAERVSERQLAEERNLVSEASIREVLNASPNAAAILDATRQIIFCNRTLVGVTNALDEEAVWGARPGEALGCQHARSTPGGCGTTEFCRTCGAVLAILDGQRGRPSTRECRITRGCGDRFEPLDLRVTVAPISIGQRFVVCCVQDISHEKRRLALERVFFHDILNSALALQTHAQVLAARNAAAPSGSDLALLSRDAERLLSEIEAERMLLAAERGELVVRSTPTTSMAVLRQVIEQFRLQPIAENKHLQIRRSAGDLPMVSDTTLLTRVLTNMVKNALEASRAGATVMLDSRPEGQHVEFAVHNEGEIPRDVQLQIFQRSFSTKGAARGLGTYSMKLFAGRLHGQLWFESSPRRGTTFVLRVPARQGQAQATRGDKGQ